MKLKKIDSETVKLYLSYFKEALLINEDACYEVKGQKYMDTPYRDKNGILFIGIRVFLLDDHYMN